MSVHANHTAAVDPTAAAADPKKETEQPAHGGRGHIIGMILCCIPMVIAIVWILAASNR